MSAREGSSRTGRRRFLRSIAIAGVAASVAPIETLAQAGKPGEKKVEDPKPATPAPAAPTPPSEDARALAAMLKRRHPQLDDAKLAGITRELDQRLDGGRRLRAVKLPNSAEPDSTFRV